MNKRYINSEEDSIGRYFRDIRQDELLTAEEEIALAIRIKDGDPIAVEELVRANLKFVVSVAKEYQGQGLPLPDLINEGNYGLIKAALRFDHERGFRFISYAVYWVKQAIIQSLNDNARAIRLPSNIINKLYKIKKQIELFESENGRSPIDGDEVWGNEEFEEFNNLPVCTSLNTKINEEGDELVELMEDETFDSPDATLFEVSDDIIKAKLHETLEVLDERERNIIQCYFGINTTCEAMTLEAIGEEYDLSKERVRQIKEKAIRKLRHNVHDLFALINE